MGQVGNTNRRVQMRYLTFSALVVFLSASVASAQSGYCRAQILMDCANECKPANNQPADVSLDFIKKTGELCWGEHCFPGKLSFKDQTGQWDHRRYRTFILVDTKSVLASGAIDTNSNTFFAKSDAGTLFGRCQ
jgi:hypothetical protein